MKSFKDYIAETEQQFHEKAVSQQQQKFMGMVHAIQKGEKVKGASPELKKTARTMGKSDAKDFAATKHAGLPKKVDEISLGDYQRKAGMNKALSQMGAAFAASPEEREKNLSIAGRREKGLARAKARSDKSTAEINARRNAEHEKSIRDKYAGVDIDAEIARLQPAIKSAYNDYQYGASNTWSQGKAEYDRLTAKVKELERAKQLSSGPSESVTESAMLDESGETLVHILSRFKHEVKQFEAGHDLDDDLYDALYDYYVDNGEMPYGVAKARTGDPFEWITQRLVDELGLSEASPGIPAFQRKNNSRLGGFPASMPSSAPSGSTRPENVPAFQRKATGKDFPVSMGQVQDNSDKLSDLATLRRMAGLPLGK
jgi:hypothetical protein